MTTAVFKSFKPQHDLMIVKLDGKATEIALRVSDIDKSTIAGLHPSQKIRFDFVCDRHGHVFAVDVVPFSSLSASKVDEPEGSLRKTGKSRDAGSSRFDAWDSARQMDYLQPGDQPEVEELLSSPAIRRLMARDRINPQSVRRMVVSIARQTGRSR